MAMATEAARDVKIPASSRPSLQMAIVVLMFNWASPAAYAETLQGFINCAPQWGSCWLDLPIALDLHSGEKLKLLLTSDGAQKILVRLLPKGGNPNDRSGVVDGPITVPPSGVVEVPLAQEFHSVIQISVHGGPNPFGIPLPTDNKAANLIGIERIVP